MRSPSRPIPDAVERWTRWASALRAADALAAWCAAWVGLVILTGWSAASEPAVLAAVLVACAAFVRPIRVRWRPVSAWVGATVARPLRPGDRAWFVRPRQAEPVIVTARRGLRFVVAQPGSAAEGLEVRASRVILLPD
jgi:hypothetical protein